MSYVDSRVTVYKLEKVSVRAREVRVSQVFFVFCFLKYNFHCIVSCLFQGGLRVDRFRVRVYRIDGRLHRFESMCVEL